MGFHPDKCSVLYVTRKKNPIKFDYTLSRFIFQIFIFFLFFLIISCILFHFPELTIHRTRDEHINHYTTDVSWHKQWVRFDMDSDISYANLRRWWNGSRTYGICLIHVEVENGWAYQMREKCPLVRYLSVCLQSSMFFFCFFFIDVENICSHFVISIYTQSMLYR